MRDLSQRYFCWLYDQVFTVRDSDSQLSYLKLCDIMHQKLFNAIIPQDINRNADGSELRNEFIKEMDVVTGLATWDELLASDASIFEVLIGISKRADFMVDRTVGWWFKQFLINLGLVHLNDKRILPTDMWRIERKLNRFNDRAYGPSGRGGIFPLEIPNQDQRNVELWLQMSAYMTENMMY